MAQKVTIKDIAREAGVSYQAVSAILKRDKGSMRFSQATSEKVLSIAKDMNYRPSLIARSFRSEKSYLIGVQLYHLINSYNTAEYIYGLQERLGQDDFCPIFLIADSTKKEKENIDRFNFRNVDGYILSPIKNDVDYFSNINLPCVQIGKNIPNIPFIKQDMFQFGYDATKKFLNSGHENIALLTHDRYRTAETIPEDNWDAWEQYLGYTAALDEAGLPAKVLTFPIREAREDAVRWYWDTAPFAERIVSDKKITAILCYSCFSSYRLLEAAKNIGRKVPDDLALIGYGNFLLNSILKPQISTYDVDWKEIGKAAAESISNMISGIEVSGKYMKSHFIEGGTH